jgi:hypothetical protein
MNNLEILTKLHKLQQKRNKHHSNEENQGKIIRKRSYFIFQFIDWIKCGIKENEIVKMIWKIWCYEREHCPRAGIIFLYFDKLGLAEVSFSSTNYL